MPPPILRYFLAGWLAPSICPLAGTKALRAGCASTIHSLPVRNHSLLPAPQLKPVYDQGHPLHLQKNLVLKPWLPKAGSEKIWSIEEVPRHWSLEQI